MTPPLWIALVVLAVLAVVVIVMVNAMIRSRNHVEEAWSGIDVQLKRRHDLVPRLVEVVRGYARHEREVFERTTAARAEAMRVLGSSPAAESEAESELSRAVTDVRFVAEAYPDLGAAESFQQLQRQIAQIEDEIQAARRIYNSNARTFNTRIQVWPNAVVARLARFRPREYFGDLGVTERDATDIDLSQR